MKTQSQALRDEKAKGSVVGPFRLLDIGAYHMTDCPSPITVEDVAYATYPLQFPEFKSAAIGAIEAVSIQIANVDLAMSAAVLNNAFKSAEVTAREAWFDINMELIGVETLYTGVVKGRPAIDHEWIAVSIIPRGGSGTMRKIEKTCTWKRYKDSDCGSTSPEPECGRTEEDCVLRGGRFPSSPFLPKEGERFTLFGSIPTVITPPRVIREQR